MVASIWLPSAVKSETPTIVTAPQNRLVWFPRAIERQYGESLTMRSRALSEMLSNKITTENNLDVAPIKRGNDIRHGNGHWELGLPDMIHETRYDNNADNNTERGSFCLLDGVPCTGPENMILAIKAMLAPYRNTDRLIAMYLCANVFSLVDVQVKYISADGSYTVTAVDYRNGGRGVALTEELWAETYVSSVLRSAICVSKDFLLRPPSYVRMPWLWQGLAAPARYSTDPAVAGTSSCEMSLDPDGMIDIILGFLPRFEDCGWDETRSLYPTVYHNHLTQTILWIGRLNNAARQNILRGLQRRETIDKTNKILYQCAHVSVLHELCDEEVEMMKLIDDIVKGNSDRMTQNVIRHCLVYVFNVQTRVLLKREDLPLALEVAKHAVDMAPDSFDSWVILAQVYLKSQAYKYALWAINGIPPLPKYDAFQTNWLNEPLLVGYYKKPLGNIHLSSTLDRDELRWVSRLVGLPEADVPVFGRTVMLLETGINTTEFDELGPIFGPQSANLINFLSRTETDLIVDRTLLTRSTLQNQLSLFDSTVYKLLLKMVGSIGWEGLLNLRMEVFVMEHEQTVPSARSKRLCEQWLEQVVLNLYEDLKLARVALGPEHKCSALEWQLRGLISLRTEDRKESIAYLRTALSHRFDPISAQAILELYKDFPKTSQSITADFALDLLMKKIQYDARFYDWIQANNGLVLARLCDDIGKDAIKHHIDSLIPSYIRPFMQELLLYYVS